MMGKISIVASGLLLLTLIIGFTPVNKGGRKKISINNNDWKFIRSDVKKAYKVNFDDSEWLPVTLPHDFNGGVDGVHNDVFKGRFDFTNDQDKRMMYKGIAWYRTPFEIDDEIQGKRVFINFEAVSLRAEVWVNGKKAGHHEGGYTAFGIDVTDYIKPGKNILAVKVDNSNNKTIAPWMADEKQSFPFSFDYAIYGGIYRDVYLTITDDIKIEKVLNTPVVGGQAPAVLSIDTYIKNYSAKERPITVTSTILNPSGDKVSVLKRNKTIAPGQQLSIRQSESALGDIQYWSPDAPNVYKVITQISQNGNIVDQYESSFGFRYYSLANNQPFYLNGAKVFIKGVNRHQDMEGLGYALPNDQHVKDATLIKEAGFNFVRHAHYPCDPAFAEACRDQGLMLWLEIPLTGSTSDDPAFLANCKQQLTEMIEQNYNNPAVILWGIGNESDRSGSGEDVSNHVFGELVQVCRQLDPNRSVTGCNYNFESNQKLVDIYAPQDWSGWYDTNGFSIYNPTQIIGEYGADIDINIRSNEVFDITKSYSAAGKPQMWSQEYGALLHEYKASKGLALSDQFPGHFVWVAFDFASPRAGRRTNPIPYMNQKGLMAHDHVTKKDVYYFYQSFYRKAGDCPVLHIVPGKWSQEKKPENTSVWAYSNCDSVVLYKGYKETLIGSATRTAGPRHDTRFQWDKVVPDHDIIYAEGWYNNTVVARDTVMISH